jgi:hypothetical protein
MFVFSFSTLGECVITRKPIAVPIVPAVPKVPTGQSFQASRQFKVQGFKIILRPVPKRLHVVVSAFDLFRPHKLKIRESQI